MKKYVFILLMFCLWACGKENSIKGKEYVYLAPSGFQITLGFDLTENRYFGKGVNKFFGFYNRDQNKLSFQEPSSTMMMGNRRHMAEEENFLDALSRVQFFEVTDTDLVLITQGNERFVLTRKPNSFLKESTNEK